MNPVASFTEPVSVRSTKSSAAPSDATGNTPVPEVGADGERSREFAEFLEAVPSQPVPTEGAEAAAPVVAKPIEGWSAKALASLMSFLDSAPPADPTLNPVAEEMPDDAAADVPPDEATLAAATTVIDPLTMAVAPLPQPIHNNTQPASNTDASIPESQLQPIHDTAPTAGARDSAHALGTTAAPTQAATQAAAQSATQSTTPAAQPRRTTGIDTGGERRSDAPASDDAPVATDRSGADTSAPLDRVTTAAQRESTDKDARPQAKLAGDNELAAKTDGVSGPRTDALANLRSSSSAPEASEHEDVLKSANVKSVSQEAFMLPSHRAEPARQIGAAVVAEVAQTTAARPAEANASSEPVVKVLNLHLEPRELGAVHLRMQLSHGAMTLSVKVETEELASRLQRDSDILTKMLQSSGITLDGVVVQSLGVERSAFSGNDPSMNQKNQDTQSNQANPNSSGANEGRARGDESGQGGRRQGDGMERYEPASPAPSRAAATRASGAIYI